MADQEDAWQKFKRTGEEKEALDHARALVSDGARWVPLWCVAYRRSSWQESTSNVRRYFRRGGNAWRFIEEQLLGGDRPELGEVEYTLERIWTLGDWEVISERA